MKRRAISPRHRQNPNRARDEFHLAATAQNLRKLAKLIPVPVTTSAT